MVKKFEDMYNRLHSIPACDGRRAVKSSNLKKINLITRHM